MAPLETVIQGFRLAWRMRVFAVFAVFAIEFFDRLATFFRQRLKADRLNWSM